MKMAKLIVALLVTLLVIGTHPSPAASRPTPPSSSGSVANGVFWAVRAMYGPIVGPKVRLPYGHGWGSNSNYGRPSQTGVLTSEYSSMSDIAELARKYRVPWATTDRPTEKHNVYQIWGVRNNRSVVLFKYGITRVSLGSKRPDSQRSACRRYMKTAQGDKTPECRWGWLRKETSNFMRARRVEATYITEYKIRNGKCPPGARSCR